MPSTLRALNQLSDEQLKPMWGKILTDNERSITVTGPAIIQKPDGSLLAVYVPGAISDQLRHESYDTLHDLRKIQTNNRGLASGMQRFAPEGKTRSTTAPISSAIVGSFDPVGPFQYCRLTAFTGHETQKYQGLYPLFHRIAAVFAENVPNRFKVQLDRAQRTNEDWVVPGTPYTTITVNNTYPTGVHTDSGDLHEGFSCLAVLRRGNYRGGVLTFPKFRVGVDMQDGDVLLMDAHEAHGNTHIWCVECERRYQEQLHSDLPSEAISNVHPMRGWCEEHASERISIVCYYRTKMEKCGTLEEEQAKKVALAEKDFVTVEDEARAMLAASASRGAYGK